MKCGQLKRHTRYYTLRLDCFSRSNRELPIKETEKRILEAGEMDIWRRTVRLRLERVTKERIQEIVQVIHTIVKEIKNRRLTWYGHVQRMPETVILKRVIN